MSFQPSVDKYLREAQDHLAFQGTLTGTPSSELLPGTYALNGDVGAFSVALPAATGSLRAYLFSAQSVGVHPVTLTVAAGETLNGVFNDAFVFRSNTEAYVAVDQSLGHYLWQPWGQRERPQDTMSLTATDLVALAGTYQGVSPIEGVAAGSFGFRSLAYWDQGVLRLATMLLSMNLDECGFEFSSSLMPASAQISSARADLVSFSSVRSWTPLVTVRNGREIYLRRPTSETSDTTVAVSLVILLTDSTPLTIMPGYKPARPLSYATLTLSADAASPPTVPTSISGWRLTTTSTENAIRTDGTYMTGFRPDSTYAVTYILRTFGAARGVYGARRLADGQLVAASKTVVFPEANSAAESIMPYKEFVFQPQSASDGFALDWLDAPNTVRADNTSCTVRELPPASRVGLDTHLDSLPRGHLRETPAGALLPGVYAVHAPTQGYTLTRPPATGTQRQFVFVAHDTETHPCTLAVASGDMLNGVTDDTMLLNANGTQVVLIDAAASSFVSLWLSAEPPVVDQQFVRYNGSSGTYQASALPSATSLRSLDRYEGTGTLVLTDAEQALPQLSATVQVQAGDVVAAVAVVAVVVSERTSAHVCR